MSRQVPYKELVDPDEEQWSYQRQPSAPPQEVAYTTEAPPPYHGAITQQQPQPYTYATQPQPYTYATQPQPYATQPQPVQPIVNQTTRLQPSNVNVVYVQNNSSQRRREQENEVAEHCCVAATMCALCYFCNLIVHLLTNAQC